MFDGDTASSNGVLSKQANQEINEYLDEESEFIQLMRGENTIGYAADSGDGYLSETVTFRYKYLGV